MPQAEASGGWNDGRARSESDCTVTALEHNSSCKEKTMMADKYMA